MIRKPFKKIESVNKAQTESTTTVSTLQMTTLTLMYRI